MLVTTYLWAKRHTSRHSYWCYAKYAEVDFRYNLDYLRQRGKEKAKLFIYNKNDFATTEAETLQGFEGILPPKTLELIEDGDPFYRTQEDFVSRRVCEFFEGCLRGGQVI